MMWATLRGWSRKSRSREMEKRYQNSELEPIEGRRSKRLEEQSKTVVPNKGIVG